MSPTSGSIGSTKPLSRSPAGRAVSCLMAGAAGTTSPQKSSTAQASTERKRPLTRTLPASATGGVGEVTIGYENMGGNDGWGVMVFRSESTGFTPSFSNLVQVLNCPDSTSTEWVDSPLDAGTYYYNFIEFDDTGQKGTALGEESAVVT